jgi:hypothetical protein
MRAYSAMTADDWKVYIVIKTYGFCHTGIYTAAAAYTVERIQ